MNEENYDWVKGWIDQLEEDMKQPPIEWIPCHIPNVYVSGNDTTWTGTQTNR